MTKTIDVIITDDKPRYRSLVRSMLQPSPVRIIGEAANGKELLDILRKQQPDVVLLDLEMPVMDGNETFNVLREQYPQIDIIIMSYYDESLLIEDYIKRGAGGYIPKDAIDAENLEEAITKVYNGGVFLHEPLQKNNAFTLRQKEIMPLMFSGLTNDEIAGEISISKRAIEKQRNKIYQWGGSGKAIDFYKYAFARGLQFLGKARQ